MTTRSDTEHYGGMACPIGYCTATEVCPHRLATPPDTDPSGPGDALTRLHQAADADWHDTTVIRVRVGDLRAALAAIHESRAGGGLDPQKLAPLIEEVYQRGLDGPEAAEFIAAEYAWLLLRD